MTVGKIYCAKLIYENYKHLKKQGKDSFKVSFHSSLNKVLLGVDERD